MAEGIVIVVSVLIALFADALWAGRLDRARLDGHVAALDRDFAQMEERADSSIVTGTRGVEAGFGLLVSLAGDVTQAQADSAGSKILDLASFEVFSPSVGSYEALLASGDLELLPDEDLKAELIDFFGAFEDVRVSEALLLQVQRDFLLSPEFADLAGVHRLLGYYRHVSKPFDSDCQPCGRIPNKELVLSA